MIKFLLLGLVLVWSFYASAAPRIDAFLTHIRNQSDEYSILSLQESSSLLSSQLDYAPFDFAGQMGMSVTNSEDPPVSPFSSESTERTEYHLGLSKKWLTGLTSALEYRYADNLTQFPQNQRAEFVSPDLSLSLTTSLFRELLSGKNRNLEKRVKAQAKQLSTEAKIKKKAVLVEGLLLLAELLETRNEIGLQKRLCRQVVEQSKKLARKQRRGSISKREYLLSLKEQNICLSTIKSLEKSWIEKKENLSAKFKVGADFYDGLTVEEYFTEVQQMYQTKRKNKDKAKISGRQEIIVLKQSRDFYLYRKKELGADLNPNVNLEFKVGYRGLGNTQSGAHQDITDRVYPYVFGSIEFEFPFSNRANKTSSLVNDYNLEIANRQIELQERQNRSRFRVLHEGLEKDYQIYRDYKENVSLSKRILAEAKRDFSNGRIDFYNFTEFQKGLIQSEQQLAKLRSQIVVQTIEYLDYFQFFDGYY